MIKTAVEMHVGVGTIGTVVMEGMSIGVKVIDMRQRWGIVDALVTPLNGQGEKWIEARRVNTSDSKAISV